MKKFCLKLSEILETIYSYGIIVCLFGSTLTVIGFVVALCIGGETATNICTFIYKNIFYYLIIASSFIVLLGLISLYLTGENKFKNPFKKKKKKEINK